jgi:Isochorismatase family
LMAGFGAEVTVDCTLRTANDQGYECLVLVDAYAPFDRSTGDHALSSVTMSGGIFGALGTTTALLDELAVATDLDSRPAAESPSLEPQPSPEDQAALENQEALR